MTKTRLNLSEESVFELISLLRHDLDKWAEFYTDHGPFDCDIKDICQESTKQLKTHLSWKILNQLNLKINNRLNIIVFFIQL